MGVPRTGTRCATGFPRRGCRRCPIDTLLLALAQVHAPVCALLERTGLLDTVGKDRVYPSVEEGVEAFRR